MATFRRDDALTRMATSTYDVVVIGAGMTGAGVALDAASRGLRVALIDAGDIASGTSSKSSKMVHGGLRYLQQKEFRSCTRTCASASASSRTPRSSCGRCPS